MPDSEVVYPDGQVVWSEHFANEGVGVGVATNCMDGGVPDFVPIRVRVTTEDGTGSAYLTSEEAYELVQVLGMAITKARQTQARFPPPDP